MASGRKEFTVSVPADLVRKCSGFSYDIGGSVMKVAYRTKEDYDEAMANQEKGTTGTVRMVSFSRQELDEAIKFIKERAYITRTEGEETKVFTTGLGGYQFKSKLEEAINVKNINLPEGDCINQAFLYMLRTVPRKELVHPFEDAAAQTVCKEMKSILVPIVESIKSGKTNMIIPGIQPEDLTPELLMSGLIEGMNRPGDPDKTMVEDNEDIFPAAVGILGSAFGLMKVDKDGNFSSIDLCNIGGRSCLAMANLFLGCKDFNEFMELATKGDSDNVDWCMKNLLEEQQAQSAGQEHDPDDIYAMMANSDMEANNLIFCFGQGVSKTMNDFKREDLAAALMRFYCNALALFIDANMRDAKFQDIKHVFMAGGFPGNDLARYHTTRELAYRLFVQQFAGGTRPPYQMHFLRQGQHLGSLGGLINTVENFINASTQL